MVFPNMQQKCVNHNISKKNATILKDFLSILGISHAFLKIFKIENVTICVFWGTFTNGEQFSEKGTVKYLFATLGCYLIIKFLKCYWKCVFHKKIV